jgi:hypothetical protein
MTVTELEVNVNDLGLSPSHILTGAGVIIIMTPSDR